MSRRPSPERPRHRHHAALARIKEAQARRSEVHARRWALQAEIDYQLDVGIGERLAEDLRKDLDEDG
ncbi:hypothetical protein OHT76_27685 [Streptomyces sp. NBC_00287]|uniref:hypothetical protein n=1 Tax=Streptomyces sp. NBC_00287 TaxID=2975702 RepID=UPI002E2CC8BE|nr:hypothetical protein [Streptomyces sp. NBC_00287]